MEKKVKKLFLKAAEVVSSVVWGLWCPQVAQPDGVQTPESLWDYYHQQPRKVGACSESCMNVRPPHSSRPGAAEVMSVWVQEANLREKKR
jgi:hypothetical protein